MCDLAVAYDAASDRKEVARTSRLRGRKWQGRAAAVLELKGAGASRSCPGNTCETPLLQKSMDSSPKKSLTVLPNSGKVEQLRRDAIAAPVTPAPERASSGVLEDHIIAALRTIFDPEIPLNIYELGLIYAIDIAPTGGAGHDVRVTMTLTAPACPVAGALVAEVQKKTAAVAGVSSADVNLVWEPAWTRERMGEAALLELGLL